MTTVVANSLRKQSEPNANHAISSSQAANLVAIAQKQVQETNQNDLKEKNSSNHVSQLKTKQMGITRRTNSLADLFTRRTPTPQQNSTTANTPLTNGGPKRGSSEKKSELQRLCCSFRRTRRAKTALDLGIKKAEIQQVFTPSYGTLNSSLMSSVTDPQVARRGIDALEKSMTKTLRNQMSKIMSVDEDENATAIILSPQQEQKTTPRPNGFSTDLKSKPENGEFFQKLSTSETI